MVSVERVVMVFGISVGRSCCVDEGLGEVQAAFRYVAGGQKVGNVILEMPSGTP